MEHILFDSDDFTFKYNKKLTAIIADHPKCWLFGKTTNDEVQKIAQATYNDLLKLTAQKNISSADMDAFTGRVRERIKPFNTAGLLDPLSKNIYHHTVVALR